jgi:uncharacterized cupredoxin-like copper-binding protein
MSTYSRRLSALGSLLLSISIFASPEPILADAVRHHRSAAIGEPARAYAAIRTVEITLDNTLYASETILVQSGEAVRLILQNTDQLLHVARSIPGHSEAGWRARFCFTTDRLVREERS